MSAMERSDSNSDTYRLFPWLFLVMLILFLESMFISPSGNAPEFTVKNASLTQFIYNKTNYTLSYSLALDIAIRNPNKRVGLEYRGIQVIAYYQGKRFALVTLVNSCTPFHQGRKNTTLFPSVLVRGQKKLVLLEEPDVLTSKFKSETAAGVFTIDVLLAFRDVKPINIGSGKVGCHLKLPLTNGTSAAGFNKYNTQCSSFYRDAADQRS